MSERVENSFHENQFSSLPVKYYDLSYRYDLPYDLQNNTSNIQLNMLNVWAGSAGGYLMSERNKPRSEDWKIPGRNDRDDHFNDKKGPQETPSPKPQK